jgi:hypothetical protein
MFGVAIAATAFLISPFAQTNQRAQQPTTAR